MRKPRKNASSDTATIKNCNNNIIINWIILGWIGCVDIVPLEPDSRNLPPKMILIMIL